MEAADTDDLDAILAITRQHDGAMGAAAIADWWASHPDGFVVGRGAKGDVTSFSVVVRYSVLDSHLIRRDPITAAVGQDLRRRPQPDGSEVLLHRRALGRRKGEYPSPELGSMIIDIKRVYLELRPRLARMYAVVADWDRVGPVMRVMGFGRIGSGIRLGDREFHICALDFGPGSVDGWLARHVLAESGAGGVAGGSETASSEMPSAADRPPIARLSAREREVIAALAYSLTNAELAERLFISERTANRHLSNIFTKLGVHNRTAAARIAIEAGLAG